MDKFLIGLLLGAASAGGLIVIAGMGSVITEWRRIYRLRQRADERDKARELLYSHAIGNGRPFCEDLAKQAGINSQHPAYIRWQSTLHDTHNDREILELYSQLVQPILDKQARAEISRSGSGINPYDCSKSISNGGYGVYWLEKYSVN